MGIVVGIANKDAWDRAVELRPELVTSTGQLSTSFSNMDASANILNKLGQVFLAHSTGEKIKAYTSLKAASHPSVNQDKVVLIENTTLISPQGSAGVQNQSTAASSGLVEYNVTNDLGMKKTIAHFELLENTRGKRKDGTDAPSQVYLEKQNYFPVPPELYTEETDLRTFLQKPIELNYSDIEDINSNKNTIKDMKTNKWWDKKHATVLPIKKTDTAYLITWDTKRKTLKTATAEDVENGDFFDDPSYVNGEAKTDAFSFFLANQSMRIEKAIFQSWATSNCFIAGTYIANRPSSTYQLLIGIKRPAFDALELGESTELGSHVLKISYQSLISSAEMVGKLFYGELNRLTQKHNVSLNMRKEAQYLKSWVEDIIGLRNQRTPGPTDTEDIEIVFDENYKIAHLLIVPEKGEKISLLSPPPGKTNELYFPELDRPRTALYLMHIEEMAAAAVGIDETLLPPNTSIAGYTPTWAEYLTKYTFDMPAIYIKSGKVPTPKTLATEKIQKAQKKLLGRLSGKDRDSVLAEALTPHVKGILADAKANAYMKLQDPTIKKILFGAIGFKSTTELYEQVLSKIDIHQLIYLAKLASDPTRSAELFSNKFEIENLGKKWKKINWEKDFTLAKNNIVPAKAKSTAISLPDTKTVVDVTAKSAQAAYFSLQHSLGAVLQEHVKTLLQTIINWLKGTKAPNSPEDEFTKSSLPDKVTGAKLAEVQNNLENMPGVFPLQLDIPFIFSILVNNATPKELISIFESNGNLKVIEILQGALVDNILILDDVLTDVYKTEDFLIMLGAPFLDELIDDVASMEIDKRENQIYGSFCEEDVESVINHLLERFPENIARSQIEKNKLEKEKFLNYLNKFQDAVENNFEQFLFGEKFEDILEFGGNDPSNKSMLDMTLSSYFSPVMNMAAIESMNVGSFFLETQAVPQDSDLKVVRYAYDGLEGEDAGKSPDNYTITYDIKYQLKDLQKNLQNPENFSWTWNKEPGGGGADVYYLIMPSTTARNSSRIEMEFAGMGNYDILTEDEGWKKLARESSDENPEEYEQTKQAFQNSETSNENNYKTKISLVNGSKREVEFTRYTPISSDVREMVNVEDIGITPQASAYSTFVNDRITNYIESNLEYFDWWSTSDGNSPQQRAVNSFGNEVNNTLFSYSNEKFLEFMALKISTGPFFEKSNLQKFRVDTPTQGLPQAFNDTYEPLEGQTGNPEAGKPNKKIDDFLSLNVVLEKTRLKKNYFEILKRQDSTFGRTRSPIEHALIIESIDLLFSTFVLEMLIAGMPVYSDISTATLSNYQGNLEIFKNVMTKQLAVFGEGTKQQFFNLLAEYILFRKAIDTEKLYSQEVPEGLDTDNIDQIMNFVLKEKLLEITPFFQKKAQMAIGDTHLEQKDFLDLIPNVHCAPASKFLSSGDQGSLSFNTFPPRLVDNKDIPFNVIALSGGFVLETYMKCAASPVGTSLGATTEVYEKLKNDFILKPLATIGQLRLDQQGEKQKVSLATFTDEQDGGAKQWAGDGFGGGTLTLINFLKAIAEKDHTSIPSIYSGFALTKFAPNGVESLESVVQRYQYLKWRFETQGISWFENVQPEYDKYLKQLKFNYAQLRPNQTYLMGSSQGVVYPPTFQRMQEEIKQHNLVTMQAVAQKKWNANNLFDKFAAQQTIVTQAWNKYLKKVSAIDSWYKLYKESVKKSPAPGHAPSDSAFIFERIDGKDHDGHGAFRETLSEGGFFSSDVVKVYPTTDRKLWEDWESFSLQLIEHLQDIPEGFESIAEYEAAYWKSNFSVKGVKEWAFDQELDEVTRDIDTNFYPGLGAGLRFYDKTLEEMQKKYDNIVDKNSINPVWAELRNTYITDRTQLLIRKNMFDIGFPLSIENIEDIGNTSFDEYVTWETVSEEFLDAFEELTYAQKVADQLESSIARIQSPKWKDHNAAMSEIRGEGMSDYQEFLTSQIEDEFQKQMEKAFFKPASIYFPELKYGIRLMYYMPQPKDAEECPAGETPIISADERIRQAIENFSTFAGHPSYPPNYHDKILRTTEISVQSDSYKPTDFNAISLFEMEENVATYTGDPELTLDSDAIMQNFDNAIKDLKNKLQDSQQYKNVISEIMYFPELINALGLYCAFSVSEDLFSSNSLGLFSGTKYNLMQIIQSVLRDQNTVFLDPENKSLDKVKNNFANLQNPTGDPSPTGEVFSDAIGAAAIMASKTAINILKGIVETTDPAIILGKKIQSLAIAALSVTKKVGETVGTINSSITTVEAATTADSGEIGEGTNDAKETLGDIKKGIDNTMEGVDNAAKAVASAAGLSTIVFATAPFPLGPNFVTPITPAGIAYLIAATSMEAT